MTYRLTCLAAAAALWCGQAAAQNPITYVDAELGVNTVQQDLSIFGGDDWVVRQEFGVGGSLLQFNAEGPDPTELVTTISGLTPGVEYNLYAFFWDDTPEANNWFIDVNLAGGMSTPDGDFDTFVAAGESSQLDNEAGPVFEAAQLPIGNLSAINGENARTNSAGEMLDTTNIIDLTPGVSGNDTTISDGSGTNTDLFAALFETITADSSGEVDVFIRNTTNTNRVWYDGIGFQPTAGTIADFDNDGNVDLDDYAEIASRIGGPAVTPGSAGDAFGDGVIDLRDFAVWQQNRTDTQVGAAAVGVPEPLSLGLVVSPVLAALGLRRRR